MKTKLIIASLCAVFSVGAFAQASQGNAKGGMGSSNAKGVQIQGNTEIIADQKNAAAVAVGEGNKAQNAAGAIKGGTQIQGNTKIKAKQKNAVAIAAGKNNKAANEAGVVGGN